MHVLDVLCNLSVGLLVNVLCDMHVHRGEKAHPNIIVKKLGLMCDESM